MNVKQNSKAARDYIPTLVVDRVWNGKSSIQVCIVVCVPVGKTHPLYLLSPRQKVMDNPKYYCYHCNRRWGKITNEDTGFIDDCLRWYFLTMGRFPLPVCCVYRKERKGKLFNVTWNATTSTCSLLFPKIHYNNEMHGLWSDLLFQVSYGLKSSRISVSKFTQHHCQGTCCGPKGLLADNIKVGW